MACAARHDSEVVMVEEKLEDRHALASIHWLHVARRGDPAALAWLQPLFYISTSIRLLCDATRVPLLSPEYLQAMQMTMYGETLTQSSSTGRIPVCGPAKGAS